MRYRIFSGQFYYFQSYLFQRLILYINRQIGNLFEFIRIKKTADEAKKKLDEGVDFAEVAKEYSEDESSADDGGEVGIIAKGETVGLPPEIEDAVFSQEEGEYSDVIATGEKFFVVKTLKIYPRSEPKFEEVKDEIEARILAQKAGEPLNMWVLNLFEEAEIEVIYPIYQEMTGDAMIPEGG